MWKEKKEVEAKFRLEERGEKRKERREKRKKREQVGGRREVMKRNYKK